MKNLSRMGWSSTTTYPNPKKPFCCWHSYYLTIANEETGFSEDARSHRR